MTEIAEKSRKRIRWGVLLPPLLITAAIVVLNMLDYSLFLKTMSAAVNWILTTFSWLFNLTTCVAVILIIIAYFSPLGKVRFGGSKAKPILKYPSLVWIVVFTIMGSGLMLWACAEPMYHLYFPPANITEGALSGQAIQWTMETLFMEWTFAPMAIYALPAIVFGFVFYNMKKPYTTGSMFYPLIEAGNTRGETWIRRITPAVDCICVFCLCMGMAAAIGSSILVVCGGLTKVSGGAITSSPLLIALTGLGLVAAFVTASSTGLRRGIRYCSLVNSYFHLILGIFVLLAGPTIYMLDLCVESFGCYLSDFFRLGLWTSTAWGDGWSKLWPTFYWCMWLAWMPSSAVFLGRIARGYTVREMLNAIFLLPGLFSVIWITIFSGTSIHFELSGLGLYDAMQTGGIEAAAYALLEHLPLAVLIIPLFLLTAVLSCITCANSNTTAIAGLCTEGITTEDSESLIVMKIVWGVTIGALCVIMLIAFDFNGLKSLANLGGLPALLLMLPFMAAFVKIMRNPKKYDLYQEDYDERGTPLPSKRLPCEGSENSKPTLYERVKKRFGTENPKAAR